MNLDEKSRTWLHRLVWIVFGIVLLQGMFRCPGIRLGPVVSGTLPIVGDIAGVVTASVGFTWRCAMAADRGHCGPSGADPVARPRPGLARGRPHRGYRHQDVLPAAVPPDVQVSDHATYSGLAQKLVRGEPCTHGQYLRLLAARLSVFLCGGILAVRRASLGNRAGQSRALRGDLGRHLEAGKAISGESAARIAIALIAVWPNLVISTSLAKKSCCWRC